MLNLTAATTALVLIDLQKGIVAIPSLGPSNGADTAAAGARLAARFRTAAAPVVLVNVAFAADFGDAPKGAVDAPLAHPPGGLPADFAELVDGLAQPGDIRVTKHQWGAFYGTDLDVQLRRRGVRTVVIAGIATNMGVESTARQAHEHGYNVVIVEDASAGITAELHAFAFKSIFPMLSRVVRSDGLALTA